MTEGKRRLFATYIIVAGGILFLSFLTFTILYPLGRLYANIIPNAIETKPAWSLIERGIIVLDKPLYVAAMIALSLIYLGALVLVLKRAQSSSGEEGSDASLSRLVLLIGLACAVTLLWSYPLFSQDVFDYMFHTREWAHYGASPFTHTPSQFSADPLFQYVSWTEAPSPYGPLWILLTAPLSLLAGGDLFANIILFKGLAVACYAGSAWLLYLTLGKVLPKYRLAGTLLFAWNPLVLMEFGGSGHNDIVMLFFVMLAVWLLVKGRLALALTAVTASTLIKIITVFVLPLFILYVWKELCRRDTVGRASLHRSSTLSMRYQAGGMTQTPARSMMLYLLLCVGMVVLLYTPLWEGISSMAFLRRGDIIGGAPVGNVVTDLMAGAGLGHDLAADVWRMLSWGSFGALILRQMWVLWQGSAHFASYLPGFSWLNEMVGWVIVGPHALGKEVAASRTPGEGGIWRESDIERLFRTSMSLLFFYAVVVSQYYQPWYLSWAIIWAGGLLRPPYRVMVWTLLVFCVVAVVGYIYL